MTEKVVAVSGGFDPIHVGHIRMFKEAKKLGTKLVVVLNNDNWLLKKKGYVFMSAQERKEIVESLLDVDEVIITNHEKDPEDISVCKELEELRPHIFANGGDKKEDNIPEYKLCNQLDIEMIFNVGGEQIKFDSELVSDYHK
jgi:D-beta-D-heptose 7-phosphate kinase/D-beta-D-heptose 1-phosphate adenosyltransferase